MSNSSEHLVPEWIRSLRPYPPGKPIEEVEREYGISDSIKVASNENPLGPSPKALDAIRESLTSLHRYPEGNCYYLAEALSDHLGVKRDQIIFGNGSNEIIELLVRTFVRPGDEVVVADQAFVVYRLILQAIGVSPIVVPLRDYTHDLGAMAAAMNERTRMVFVANPNNPTGTIVRAKEFREFLASVPSDAIVVMDEAYAEYVSDPEYPDSLSMLSDNPLLITLRTFSKIYGLAGLRIGYGVAAAELVDLMNRIRQPFNVNSLAQRAAVAALSDDQHLKRSRETNSEGMTYLQGEFDRMGLAWVPSWANFLLVEVEGGVATYQSLLRRGVITRAMDGYGLPDHLRMTIGTRDENQRMIASLEEVLADRVTP